MDAMLFSPYYLN